MGSTVGRVALVKRATVLDEKTNFNSTRLMGCTPKGASDIC